MPAASSPATGSPRARCDVDDASRCARADRAPGPSRRRADSPSVTSRPVSSRASRTAACSTVSPMSTKPPGRAWPGGGWPRLTSTTGRPGSVLELDHEVDRDLRRARPRHQAAPPAGAGEIGTDQAPAEVQERDQRDRHRHLVGVVDGADREEQRDRPVLRSEHEGDVEHDEAVDELRNGGGAGRAQPHEALAGGARGCAGTPRRRSAGRPGRRRPSRRSSTAPGRRCSRTPPACRARPARRRPRPTSPRARARSRGRRTGRRRR